MDKASVAQTRKDVLTQRFTDAEKQLGKPSKYFALICDDCPEEVRRDTLEELINSVDGWSISSYKEDKDFCPYHKNKRITEIQAMVTASTSGKRQ